MSVFHAPPSNALLASLPSDEYRRLERLLEPVDFPARKVLYRQNQPVERVYFPSGGACSLVKVMEDGQAAEVAAVGAEGLLGGSVFFGQSLAECDVLVQVAGPAGYALGTRAFISEMEERSGFFNSVIRAAQALSLQVQQTTACNALHRCEQRCSRWLLTMRDRTNSDDLKVTHDFLATMLGVRRPTITLVLGTLSRAGLIGRDDHKGSIHIVDLEGLKAASCECYEVIQNQSKRLTPHLEVVASSLGL